MKAIGKSVLAISAGFLILVSAAFAEDLPYSGFLGNPSAYDLLQPGPKGGIRMRWLKPGVDFGKYDKFMVDSAVFFLADQAEYKGIDPQEMKEMCDAFNQAVVAAMKDKYPMVAEPGPNVARIRIAITNIKPSRPGISAVTTILPVGLAVSLVKKGATGGWMGSGETGMEAIVLDSTTGEVVAMGVDERKAEFSQRFSKWGSTADAFKFWAENAVRNLEQFHKADLVKQ